LPHRGTGRMATPKTWLALTNDELARSSHQLPPYPRWTLASRFWFRVMAGQRSPAPDKVKLWDVGNVLELAADFPMNAAILDCGAFNSPSPDALVARGFNNVHGIDLNPAVVWQSSRARVSYTVQDMQCTGFVDSCFDLVVCASAIEHGVDVARFLRETRRLLKPAGLLYISTDVVRDATPARHVTCYGLPWTPQTPETLPDLLDELERHGFARPPDPQLSLPAVLPLEFGGVPLGFVACATHVA